MRSHNNENQKCKYLGNLITCGICKKSIFNWWVNFYQLGTFEIYLFLDDYNNSNKCFAYVIKCYIKKVCFLKIYSNFL